MSIGSQPLIVGAGPVGLTTAILLKLRGINPVVIEKREDLVSLPQAHVINTRTMEIFDEIGVADAVKAASRTLTKTRNVLWCESLAGREFGRIAAPVGDAEFKRKLASISDHVVTNLAQNLLEPILLDRFRALGGEVLFGHEFVSLGGDHQNLSIDVSNKHGVSTMAPSCLLACDGAGSSVRRKAGLLMEGPTSLARFLTIYFDADLRDLLVDREGPLYWVAGPDVRGFFIWFDFERTWAFLAPIGDAPADSFDEAAARGILRKAIGEDRDITLAGTSVWNMSAQVADRFKDGHILLLGDAAHRFPPTGGLGLNTGVQDAHNLVWKISAVEAGWADASLLDSYEPERRPVALRNCDQSVFNFHRMTEVDDVLGVPTLSPIALDAGEGEVTRYSAQVLGLDGESEEAHAKRAALAQAIDNQKAHFQISFGAQLGFRYENGAIISDGSVAPPDLPEVYVPVGRPGSRLPHFQMSSGVSIHAMLSRDGFTMLSANDQWIAAAQASCGHVPIGAILLSPEAAQHLDLLGIGLDGAVLVRPDGHVGWRSRDALSASPSLITQVIAELTRKPAKQHPDQG
jgi:2,4-dichlorophenol 6-monooxygenase